MRVVLRSSVQALVLLVGVALPAVAQERVTRTQTTGLFVGYRTEANVVTSQPGAPSFANAPAVGQGIGSRANGRRTVMQDGPASKRREETARA